jgi:hypothetical protein
MPAVDVIVLFKKSRHNKKEHLRRPSGRHRNETTNGRTV